MSFVASTIVKASIANQSDNEICGGVQLIISLLRSRVDDESAIRLANCLRGLILARGLPDFLPFEVSHSFVFKYVRS